MPVTSTEPQGVDEYIHGVMVRDPYRWLEDRDLPETEAWIREQQKRCDEYFAECGDYSSIRETVAGYLDAETVDQPARIGNRYFFRRRDRGQEQGCIYVRDAITSEENVLVDPSPHGPYVSVRIHRISRDGGLLAYEVRHGGEDQAEIRILEVDSTTTLEDRVERGIQRGFEFMSDCSGYIYSVNRPNYQGDHVIRLHKLGSNAEDLILFRAPSLPQSRLTLRSDGDMIGVLNAYERDGNLVADLWIASQVSPSSWEPVVRQKPLPYAAWMQGGRLFLFSSAQEKRGQVVEINSQGEEIRTIVPDCGEPVHQLARWGSHVCVLYRVKSDFRLCCWETNAPYCRDVALPKGGTIKILPQLSEEGSCFLSYESFTQSTTIFEYALNSDALHVWSAPTLQRSTEDFQVRELEYPSANGAMIPLTLIHTSDVTGRGPRPLLMTSYGGFGAISTPQFSILVSILVDIGFTFALPHVRGSGELGPTWHEAGRRRNKQSTFTDFIMAAEWLIEQGIAAPGQLAMFGGSNSGLLVGAVATQAPTLFRVALCIAPLLDMVRYERFNRAVQWRTEYGTVEDEEDFHVLLSYSPYHAIREDVDYPAILFVTGDKDERCDPAHVRKTAERMARSSAQSHSVLVDYDEERGHSPVMPLHVRIDALTRRVAFVLRELGSIANIGGQVDPTSV